MNIPINTDTITTFVLGIAVTIFCFLILFGIRKITKPKIDLSRMRVQVEEADKHMRAANKNLNKLYEIFLLLEKQ